MEFDEMKEELAPVIEPLSKNIKLIVLLLLVVAALYYYFYVFPKPGIGTIYVKELDGNPLNDAEVRIIDNGKTIATELTADGGRIEIPNLPSEKDLQVEAEKGASYTAGISTLRVNNGDRGTATVELEKRSSLDFVSNNIPNTVPLGCSDTFNVKVKNNARIDAFEVEFVVEGTGLPEIISAQGKQLVYPNFTTDFAVKISAEPKPGEDPNQRLGEKKGTIRIKKTRTQLPISINLMPKTQLQLSPTEISISNTKPAKEVIIISNAETSPTVTGLNISFSSDIDLRKECGSDLSGCLSIESVAGGLKSELRPGERMLFGLNIRPPSTPGKKYLASMLVTGDCFKDSPIVVPISFTLAEIG